MGGLRGKIGGDRDGQMDMGHMDRYILLDMSHHVELFHYWYLTCGCDRLMGSARCSIEVITTAILIGLKFDLDI